MRISRIAAACGLFGVACGNAVPDAKAPEAVASVDVPTASAEPEPPSAETAAPEPSHAPKMPPKQSPEDPDPVPSSAPLALPFASAPSASPPVASGPVAGPAARSGGSSGVVSSASAPNADLDALAVSDAASMTAAGVTLAGRFKTGDTLEFQLILLPGRCYAVIAAGAAQVQKIDIQLTIAVPSLPPMVLAQAKGGKTASIGGKSPGCFKNPMPISMPGTVTMTVSAGTGVAGVRVYAK
jgi:hypothetical protein